MSNAWWTIHHDEIVDRACKVMRLNDPTDPDLARVERAAFRAGMEIDNRLDRGNCPIDPVSTPTPLLGAAVEVTINLYRRDAAPFGQVSGFSDGASPATIYSDPLEGVYPSIAPYRRLWGVA